MQGCLQSLDGSIHSFGNKLTPIECFRCGICCSRYRPPATPQEIELAAQHLLISTRQFISKYVIQVPYIGASIFDAQNGACPFLGWEHKIRKATCIIYPVRPKVCRDWQSDLSHPECQEGLASLGKIDCILLPQELYSSHEEIISFVRPLRMMRRRGYIRSYLQNDTVT